MRKTLSGQTILKNYRGNILVSATKTNVSIEKDGETYETGTRNLPVGTYTVTATPQGTAELTTLEVNGNPFVSGGTVNIGFGGNLNIVAVSEGGEPEPVRNLRNTTWVRRGGTPITELLRLDDDDRLYRCTVEFDYNSKHIVLGSNSANRLYIFQPRGEEFEGYYMFQDSNGKAYTMSKFDPDYELYDYDYYDDALDYNSLLNVDITVKFYDTGYPTNTKIVDFMNKYFTNVI